MSQWHAEMFTSRNSSRIASLIDDCVFIIHPSIHIFLSPRPAREHTESRGCDRRGAAGCGRGGEEETEERFV